MPEIVSESEALPDAYPATPSGLSTAAAALDPQAIWQRIEAYMAHRFAERDVTWIVEGEGDWTPRLAPVALTSVERWNGSAWEAVTLAAGPYGYCLPDCGPYRVVATVGSDDPVPGAVQEAYRRLAEYLAPQGVDGFLDSRPGASSHSAKVMEHLDVSFDRAPTWLARAMQYSGAADLLRPYRRA